MSRDDEDTRGSSTSCWRRNETRDLQARNGRFVDVEADGANGVSEVL